jgi:hypothetical protein
MAKKKKKSSPKKSYKPKSKTMATKKRKRARPAGSPARRTTTKRRRSRGLSAGPRNLMSAVKPNLVGAAGGVAYGLAGGFLPANYRPWAGLVAGVALSYAGMNNLGVGMSGAAAFDFVSKSFGLSDDMEAMEYVQPTILSDNYALSDYETMDESGNVYALSDDGQDWEYVGTIPTQSVSLDPLYN